MLFTSPIILTPAFLDRFDSALSYQVLTNALKARLAFNHVGEVM